MLTSFLRCRHTVPASPMRKCWNRQTGTFEVRVSMTCGFKSHLPHQQKERRDVVLGALCFCGTAFFTALCLHSDTKAAQATVKRRIVVWRRNRAARSGTAARNALLSRRLVVTCCSRTRCVPASSCNIPRRADRSAPPGFLLGVPATKCGQAAYRRVKRVSANQIKKVKLWRSSSC